MRVMRFLVLCAVAVGASLTLVRAQSPAVPPVSAAPRPLPQAAPTPLPTPGAERGKWQEFMLRYHDVRRVPKSQAVRLSEKYAKPNAVSPFSMEVVGEDAEFLYLKHLPIEDPASPGHKAWLRHEGAEAQLSLVKEHEEKYFIIDPFVLLVPPPFTDRLRFTERSEGLPVGGKWQIGFATGDFNRDGLIDLAFPPPRLGDGMPVVLLQTAAGWQHWEAVKWPEARFDYGDAGVADFDGDGHLDIALACHFSRNFVLYGNGKGDFTRMTELPRINPAVSSRALEVGDVDRDGRPDLVFLAELDMEMGTNQQLSSGLVTVCLNAKSGWRAVEGAGGRPNLFGDQLALGDLDADGDLDVLVASHKNVNRYLVYLNGGDGAEWTPVALDEFPFRAYVNGVATANLDSVPGDEAVMAFTQRIQSGSLKFPRNGLAAYSFIVGPGGLEMKERRMLDIDGSDQSSYTCAAAGDLDRDGRIDLAFGRVDGVVRVFLQGVDGTFMEERSPELSLGEVWINSLRILEVGKGGTPALVVNTSDSSKENRGSVRCFVVGE